MKGGRNRGNGKRDWTPSPLSSASRSPTHTHKLFPTLPSFQACDSDEEDKEEDNEPKIKAAPATPAAPPATVVLAVPPAPPAPAEEKPATVGAAEEEEQEEEQEKGVVDKAGEGRDPRPPQAVQIVDVPLDFSPELPDGIHLSVFRKVLYSAHRVDKIHGKEHGVMYVLVPDGTELLDVGYPLDSSGTMRAFLDGNVCFMTSDIDEELTELLSYDGAHIIGGQSGLFLAICYQIEASGHLPRREFLLEGRGTKQNVRGACQSQQQRHSRSAPHPPTHPPTHPVSNKDVGF